MTREKFKELFDKHFDSVRRFVYYRCGNTELATDIAQETFLRVWEKQIGFDDKNPKAYLFKIADNLFISSYRKDKVARKFELHYKQTGDSDTTQNELEFKELNERYDAILNKMPEKQRVVFLMSRMEELKYSEIADRLNLSIKAVEKRMTAALTVLRLNLLD